MTDEMQAKLADLKVQAMLLDMELDIEALTLAPAPEKAPQWLLNVRDKQKDNDPADPEQAWDEEIQHGLTSN